MIFLGAGASEPYGIPTLEEFSEDVLNKLRQIGHEEVIRNIQESLKEFGMTTDFESLYSILEGLTNPVKSVQYAGSLTAFLVRSKRNLPIGYDYTQVLSDLRRIIYDKCLTISDEETFKKVERCLDQLLEVTKENTCMERIVGKTDPKYVNIGKIFATTNYDMALELYFLSKEVPVTDGYEDTGALVKHFNPLLLSNPYTPERSRGIIKLHGSIWQFLRGKEMIKTKLDPHSDAFPFKIQVEILNVHTSDKPLWLGMRRPKLNHKKFRIREKMHIACMLMLQVRLRALTMQLKGYHRWNPSGVPKIDARASYFSSRFLPCLRHLHTFV